MLKDPLRLKSNCGAVLSYSEGSQWPGCSRDRGHTDDCKRPVGHAVEPYTGNGLKRFILCRKMVLLPPATDTQSTGEGCSKVAASLVPHSCESAFSIS